LQDWTRRFPTEDRGYAVGHFLLSRRRVLDSSQQRQVGVAQRRSELPADSSPQSVAEYDDFDLPFFPVTHQYRITGGLGQMPDRGTTAPCSSVAASHEPARVQLTEPDDVAGIHTARHPHGTCRCQNPYSSRSPVVLVDQAAQPVTPFDLPPHRLRPFPRIGYSETASSVRPGVNNAPGTLGLPSGGDGRE
jgi:hypothetical protein